MRQGDPLSTLLFCLYMRHVYASVAAAANVTLYAFVDDLHVVGEPAEVLRHWLRYRRRYLPCR